MRFFARFIFIFTYFRRILQRKSRLVGQNAEIPKPKCRYTINILTAQRFLLYNKSGKANNPLRYRGYYYDTDLGLYYLQTRYYDSNTGRFINADGYISTGTGLLGYNMYAYCNNNPVMYVDSAGNSPGLIWGLVALGALDRVVCGEYAVRC